MQEQNSVYYGELFFHLESKQQTKRNNDNLPNKYGYEFLVPLDFTSFAHRISFVLLFLTILTVLLTD